MKYLPHRPIENNFAVVGAREEKNCQREKKKDKEGSQEKFSKETHKAFQKLWKRQEIEARLDC